MFETAEARQEAERFREQARRDPLTGLHNRRYVDENLPALITHAKTTGTPLTVAVLDIDHFKRINDTLSHDVGDKVLVSVAELLASAVAHAGVVARLGGEEFLIVLPDTGLAQAAQHLEHVRTTIGTHAWQPITGDLRVTVSIGATTTVAAGPGTDTPGPGTDTQSALLAAADQNLYAAKHGGRDQVVGRLQPGTRRRYRDAADVPGR